MSDSYFVGVDGGGTKTIAVAARRDGTVVAMERGTGINYHHTGLECARDHLREILNRLEGKVNGSCEELAIGMPALDRAADEALTRAFAGDCFDPALLDIQSDAYMALAGFTLGRPGMIVICGTGSILLMLDENGQQHVRGGWGHLLGDAGSGYALAIDALRAAIDDWENVGPHTALSQAAMKHFQLSNPRDLIEVLYSARCTQADIAQFGRDVLECCDRGDAMAERVTCRNMEALAANAAEMIGRVPQANHVGICGGILTNNRYAQTMFQQALACRCPEAVIGRPEFPPELGAVIHSLNKRHLLTPEVLRNLKHSYAAVTKSKLHDD